MVTELFVFQVRYTFLLQLLDELYPDEEDVNRDQNASYNGSPGYSGTATAPSLKDVVISDGVCITDPDSKILLIRYVAT